MAPWLKAIIPVIAQAATVKNAKSKSSIAGYAALGLAFVDVEIITSWPPEYQLGYSVFFVIVGALLVLKKS